MMNLNILFMALIAFQVKHKLADYILQGRYMLGKFKSGLEFIMPLSAHCLVHASMTFAILYAICKDVTFSLNMALLDFCIHFVMDRIKASPNMLGRFKNFSGNEYAFIMHGFKPPQYKNKMDDVNIGPYVELEKAEDVNSIFRSNTLFWWSLGLDQLVHHLTHYYIVYKLVMFMVVK